MAGVTRAALEQLGIRFNEDWARQRPEDTLYAALVSVSSLSLCLDGSMALPEMTMASCHIAGPCVLHIDNVANIANRSKERDVLTSAKRTLLLECRDCTDKVVHVLEHHPCPQLVDSRGCKLLIKDAKARHGIILAHTGCVLNLGRGDLTVEQDGDMSQEIVEMNQDEEAPPTTPAVQRFIDIEDSDDDDFAALTQTH